MIPGPFYKSQEKSLMPESQTQAAHSLLIRLMGLLCPPQSPCLTPTFRVCFLGELPPTLSKWLKKSIYLLEE